MEQSIGTFTQQYKRYYRSLAPILQQPKTRKYSTVIFFFLVLSLFGWYAIKPTIQTILYLQREIKDKTEVNKAIDAKINSLIQAQASYELAAPLLPLLDDAIPKSPKALELISAIGDIAKTMHASVSGIQIGTVPFVGEATKSAEKQKNKPDDFSLNITLDGSYAALHAFILELLNMRRITQIQSVNFVPTKAITATASPSASIQSPSIKLIVQVSSYYAP